MFPLFPFTLYEKLGIFHLAELILVLTDFRLDFKFRESKFSTVMQYIRSLEMGTNNKLLCLTAFDLIEVEC